MNNEISYLVSNKDIERKFHGSGSVKIIIYSQLKNTGNLFELVPESQSACFILLRTSTNSGHWTVVVRNQNIIYYFDSYGIRPDGELKNVSVSDQYLLGENVKYLTTLINKLPNNYQFFYNKIQFQKYGPEINTCGKWTTVFTLSMFHQVTLEEFQNRMLVLKNEYGTTYDQLICVLWDAF